MVIIDESKIEGIEVPGRNLKWLITPDKDGSEFMSSCLIRIPSGKVVKPAHSHPGGEEFVYIIEGSGKAYVDEEIQEISAGVGVLFPKGSIHMLKNSGNKEMKVICFFAPATSLDDYRNFDDIDFPA
jgi:quercetin dioxygenase-like cupin family protein